MVVYIGIKTENPKLLKKCLAKLFVQGLTRETLLEDDKGKTMEAMKVFSSAVGYLRDHLLTTCKGQLSGIQHSDIKWVLTVPAIWTDSSKQFMREAAEKVEHLLHILFFEF